MFETGIKISEAGRRNEEWQNPLPWFGFFCGRRGNAGGWAVSFILFLSLAKLSLIISSIPVSLDSECAGGGLRIEARVRGDHF